MYYSFWFLDFRVPKLYYELWTLNFFISIYMFQAVNLLLISLYFGKISIVYGSAILLKLWTCPENSVIFPNLYCRNFESSTQVRNLPSCFCLINNTCPYELLLQKKFRQNYKNDPVVRSKLLFRAKQVWTSIHGPNVFIFFTILVQFTLNFFIMTILPLVFAFSVFFIYLNTFIIKRK